MIKFDNSDFNLSFSDLILNLLCVIVFILFLAFLLINPVAKDATVKKSAEYILEMRWDKSIDCDVDLHVVTATGEHLNYSSKESPLSGIERDDLGVTADTKVKDGQAVSTNENLEIWTLRTLYPGEYQFNGHLFTCKHYGNITGGQPIPVPLPVTFKLVRLNPKYQIVHSKEIEFTYRWHEKTAFFVTIDVDGNPTIRDDGLDYKLLEPSKNLPATP